MSPALQIHTAAPGCPCPGTAFARQLFCFGGKVAPCVRSGLGSVDCPSPARRLLLSPARSALSAYVSFAFGRFASRVDPTRLWLWNCQQANGPEGVCFPCG